MGIAFEAFTIGCPCPNPSFRASLMALRSSSSPSALHFHSSISIIPPTRRLKTISPKGLAFCLQLPLLLPPTLINRSRSISCLISSAQQDSKLSDVDVQEDKSDLGPQVEDSEEAWKVTLASFKEQALKMQSISQQACEKYFKKAMVLLKETSEQYTIQGDKARDDLTTALENSPEEIKEFVEAFASIFDNDLNEVSKVRDFFVGIPYGFLLFVGGFLSFMITGSVSAIRFGVILGFALLVISFSSLLSWRRGESTSFDVKAQAAIASILFLREFRLLFTRLAFISFLAVLVSGSVVAFYMYRIVFFGEQVEGSNKP